MNALSAAENLDGVCYARLCGAEGEKKVREVGGVM